MKSVKTFMRKIRAYPAIASILLLGLAFPIHGQAFDESMLRNGDLIFQTSRSGQSRAIQLATHSPYSHCGLVYFRGGKAYVFEASYKVKRSPFRRFIGKGQDKSFAVKRLRKADSLLTRANLEKMEKQAGKFEGLPYDSFFGWGDDKIYCSELIYKIYYYALGIEIGSLAKLKDFDLSNAVVSGKMRERYGEHIPWEEPVISPASQFADSDLVEVYNNYGK